MRHQILLIFSAITALATPVKDAVLIQTVTNNIVAPDGKVIGFVKIPAGSKVTIDSEAVDSLLIHRAGETPFKAPKNCVSPDVLETPTPAPAATPVPLLQLAQKAIQNAQTQVQVAQTKAQELLTNATVQSTVEKIKTTLEQNAPASIAAPVSIAKEPVKTQDSFLANYHGSAIRAFLIAGLTPYLGSKENAVSQVTPLKIKEDIAPQAALFSLNGTEIHGINSPGTLIVSIQKEANHPDTAGLTSEDLNALKAALSEPNTYAIAQLCDAAPTSTPSTLLPKNQGLKATPYSVLLSNYDAASDTFLCRKTVWGRNDETKRLPSSALTLGGISFVLATINWTEDKLVSESAIPKDFHYDKSVIIPGKFVFLKIPFEQQTEDGICTAASSMNVIKYMDPNIALQQRELFSLFNKKMAGASATQVAAGLQDLGFETEIVIFRKIQPKQAEAKIVASLEDNRPIIAIESGHCISIIGYDKSQNKIIAWDQHGQDLTNDKGMPTGMIECNTGRFIEVIFLRKGSQSPSPKEEEQIKAVIGNTTALQKHTIVNSDPEAESFERFAIHALPSKLKSLMVQGRTILIPTREGLVSIAPQEIADSVSCKLLPENKPSQKYISELARLTAQSAGTFYSIIN